MAVCGAHQRRVGVECRGGRGGRASGRGRPGGESTRGVRGLFERRGGVSLAGWCLRLGRDGRELDGGEDRRRIAGG